MKTKEDLNVLKDFSPPSWEEWKSAVTDSLKGADYDKAMHTKTYEGITLKPIYRREDLEGLSFTDALPGAAPYIRGNDPAAFIASGWKVAQAQKNADLKELNKEILAQLQRGLGMINLYLAHADEPQGIKLANSEDFATALAGVNLAAAPLMAKLDLDDPDLFQMLKGFAEKEGQQLDKLFGILGYDPLGELARKGNIPVAPDAVQETLYLIVRERIAMAPKLRSIFIDGSIFEAAGASSAQELAYVLAIAICYIKYLLDKGLNISDIALQIAVKLSLGSNFFMEIAKIRAFRMLFSEMIKAFGGSVDEQKVWIHGKTASFNKSTYDLYVNMLRTSTEAFSGVMGGVDSLEVDAFDAALGAADSDFAKRIARNQQLILAEEAHLGKVVDPAGGCYYIESLSYELANKSWQLMQDIEAKGGMLKALETGFIHSEIEAIAKARIDNIHKRRDVIVGVNMYANPDDKCPEIKAPKATDPAIAYALASGKLPRRRAVESLEAFRSRVQAADKEIFLITMGSLAEYKARADFSTGFFQVAGFKVVSGTGYMDIPSALAAAKDYDAVCICSTDDKYVELVPLLCQGLGGKLKILAGYPADKVEDYKAAGIDIFIHIRSNAFDTLYEIASKMGVN
ncbi:MAG: methylmalonyl-CoA mutase family protein [Candidatus Cloacimonetes bacterium]|nr:methylmalonyl-CoA mutase family protein [Candidatus Cloacimonadota bacterium]